MREGPKAAAYVAAVRDLPFVSQVLAGTVPLEWVAARLVSDDPLKIVHPPERKDLQMLPRLQRALGAPANELLLVSPYFVPTREGTAALVAIAQRGVSIRVLTNSLASSDVAPVYAGYSNYRQELLRGGVRLYELKGKPEKEKDAGREHAKPVRQPRGERGAVDHQAHLGVEPGRARVEVERADEDAAARRRRSVLACRLEPTSSLPNRLPVSLASSSSAVGLSS